MTDVEELKAKSKKIRKGDRVVAIAGNEKGKIGTVQSLNGDKVVVQGLNIRKKHIKRTQEAQNGRIVEVEQPIHVSNLKVCVEGDQAKKIKIQVNDKGERHFVYKNGDEVKIYRSVKKPK